MLPQIHQEARDRSDSLHQQVRNWGVVRVFWRRESAECPRSCSARLGASGVVRFFFSRNGNEAVFSVRVRGSPLTPLWI